VAVFG